MFRLALVAIAFAPFFAADTLPNAFTVHEWGTFTSVADEAGDSVRWVSLRPPADLPCFVYHLTSQCVKCAVARERMETPVLYFYSPKPLTASVHVSFPKGVISEWYPQAAAISPRPGMVTYGVNGAIDWGPVEILPGADPALPVTGEPSHYYAARETDAAALRVGEQAEKLLFYRGIADFDTVLRARYADVMLELRNEGEEPIAFALVFENRGGKTGFRVLRNLAGTVSVDPPELTADVRTVHEELARALTDAGLYPREAAAMIETWRDSWFEEGARVFYLMPRKMVDGLLPLTIEPRPDRIERVFVGRMEVLSPAMKESIAAALAAGDTATLAKYGRFVRPFCDQILHGTKKVALAPAAAAFLPRADAELERPKSAPCQTGTPPLATDQR
jgi:hypothetical protein